MPTLVQVVRALSRRVRRGARRALSFVDGSGPELPDVVMIFGCQRSGTTMMQDLFDRDLRCRVYRDVSAISDRGGPESIELNPLSEVEAEFRRAREQFVVAKPLADSHRVRQVLDYFPGAQGIWMYRDFRDVAGSDLRYFGKENGIRNLAPMAAREPENWRSVGLSEPVAERVAEWYAPDMSTTDAAAIFWWARNALFFEQALDQDRRVRLLHYGSFVADPVDGMRTLYHWLERSWPGPRQVSIVHRGSVGRARTLELSTDVEEACEAMARRIEDARLAQNADSRASTEGRPPDA